MNKLLLLPVLAAFFSVPAQAAKIMQAILDEDRGVIVVDVGYLGCEAAKFRLQSVEVLGASNPNTLAARLVSDESGKCGKTYLELIEFPLAENGFDLERLRGGSLTIVSDDGSSATVEFPVPSKPNGLR